MKKTITKIQMKCQLKKLRTLVALLLVAGIAPAYAATINVSSLSALQTAINNASAGDTIVLANGVYTTSADVTINKQGTAAQHIVIKAQSVLGVEIKGSNGFVVNSPAKYVEIIGFKFTHAGQKSKLNGGTSFIRVLQCLFQCPGDGDYFELNGSDQEVAYCTFQNKTGLGKFIIVRGSGSQISQRHWIHHNYFKNQPVQTGNGNETIQYGLSGYSLSNTDSKFEYNLFEDCAGENELLSVKASQLTVRYNTIRNCPAQFTLRHGNRCEVYGNYFLNTPGLRIFGDDHKIYSNHYEDCSVAINIGNGDGEVADGAPLTSHDRPDRTLIVYNTLVNNTNNYKQDNRASGLGSTSTTFANNIIQGGGVSASITGPYSGTWSNNITYQTGGAGSMPSSGYTNTNPLLARDATGTFHLQSGSPAINAGTGSFAWANVDMDGQARTGTFDIGADEVSSATVNAQILSPAMVGPNAAPSGPVTPTCVPASASKDDGNVPANVLDGDLATRWSASGDGEWIQFCLTDTVAVNGVQIAFYSGNTRSSTFDILAGNNGTSWTTVATGRTSSGTSTALETFTFPTVNAKYIRIVGHGNSANLWNSYTEVVIMQGGSGNVAPTVSITSPTSGASYTSTASVSITATAADADGTVSKVEFFNGATKIGEALTSPYTLNWTGVTAGSYTLTAKATDNGSATTTSSSVNITVNACTPAVASADDGNVAANVLDNNYSTRWSASGDGQWIQFCLENATTVSGVQIAFLSGNVRTSTFDILVSTNGTSWTTAASGVVSSGTSTALESFAITPVSAKYVRIVGHGNSVNLWNSYTEVRIQTGGALMMTAETAAEKATAIKTGIRSFPNPFHLSSNISFSVQNAGQTELSVFDMAGRKVAVLVNGYLSAGEHKTVFTPTAKAKGIYLLRLVNNGKVTTHRMMQE
ncbi:T9SS type A sorting domain-containing protein [Pseudoflavitalea sp. G-6-1-2]|uniref:discoidin domain-containing protein n=1 Tax=Pseudoflavitalea sp. G-6-1-2 TaxID=2728841 RepID=UPI00146E2F97|nr:discoidin domain-containing protein [Pseudoflavitalea sp. G-6-1-2]NML21759.1 T9SS type A sorting domain-containing protein [Pseudoflavitalea sp. G-6-1-2]